MSFAKAAKAVAERAAPLAGTAAVLATQAPAAAREVNQAGPSNVALAQINRIQDGFELVDFEGSRPVFKPVFTDDDITGAAAAFVNMIDEPESETSEGSAADAVIEALASPRFRRSELARQEEMNAALAIATRVLRSPGVQRELVYAALSDPAVRDALGARGPDLDNYLVSQGFAARGLLPAPTADGEAAGVDASATITEVASDEVRAARPDVQSLGGRDPLVELVEGVIDVLKLAGERVVDFFSVLMRERLAPPPPRRATRSSAARAAAEAAEGDLDYEGPEATAAEPEAAAADDAAATASGAAKSEGANRRGPGGLLEKAGAVAVLLVLVMIFRRAGLPFMRARPF